MKKNIRFRPTENMKRFSRIFSGVFALIGVGFTLIGVTQVIPSGGGIFGLVWTAMAVGFTVLGVCGAVSKDGIYGITGLMGIEVEEGGEPAPEDTEERLKKLQSLYDQRLITAEEYEKKREEILSGL